jgi:signal transduction histidine kinase
MLAITSAWDAPLLDQPECMCLASVAPSPRHGRPDPDAPELVRFEVCDHGIGISDESQAHLFTAFW